MVRKTHGTLASEMLVALLVVAFLGCSSLIYPFGRDQGEYAYVAAAVLDGKICYRDIFNVKPPLTHVAHEISLWLFGRSMMSIRWFDLCWQAVTALVIVWIASRVTGRRWAGALAGSLYGLWYYSHSYWDTAQTDGFLILPAALAILFFQLGQESSAKWHFLASGAMIGIAVLFKYPIGILLPALLITIRPDLRKNAIILAGGFLAVIGIGAAGLATQGALKDFMAIQSFYVPQYTGNRNQFGFITSMLFDYLVFGLRHWFFLASNGVFLLFLAFNERAGFIRDTGVTAAWWAAAVASLAAQEKFYVYHSLPMLAPQAVISAAMVVWLAERLAPYRRLAMLVPAAVAVYGADGYRRAGYAEDHLALIDVLSGKNRIENVWASPRFGAWGLGGHSVQAALDVARYVRAHTAPSDRVFVWGFEPIIYFLAERACASRYIYNMTLYGDWKWGREREDFVEELKLARPAYILVVRNDAIPWVTGSADDSRTAFEHFKGFRDMVLGGYAFDTQIENFTLYRRNTMVAAGEAGAGGPRVRMNALSPNVTD